MGHMSRPRIMFSLFCQTEMCALTVNLQDTRTHSAIQQLRTTTKKKRLIHGAHKLSLSSFISGLRF